MGAIAGGNAGKETWEEESLLFFTGYSHGWNFCGRPATHPEGEALSRMTGQRERTP